jgi:hypothetical protein
MISIPKKPSGYELDPTVNKSLTTQFGQMRRVLQARGSEAQRQLGTQQNRFAAQTGGVGGASQKMAQKAQLELTRNVAEQEAGIGAQEAEARTGAMFQHKQLGLAERAQKFSEWYGMAELDENKKTNFINAAVALKKAELMDANAWAPLLAGGGPMQSFYENVYKNKPVGGVMEDFWGPTTGWSWGK